MKTRINEIKKLQKLAGIKLNENEDTNEVTITVILEPFEVKFSDEDFESKEEFLNFRNKLLKNQSFAYDTFFDNFDGQDFEDELDRQNQENWKITVK